MGIMRSLRLRKQALLAGLAVLLIGGGLIVAAFWVFFSREGAQVVYLAPNETGKFQLYAVNPEGAGESNLLAALEEGIAAFDLSADGRRAALIPAGEAPGGEIMWADLPAGPEGALPGVVCAPDRCAGPRWLADGRRLLFERWSIDETGVESPRLWWVDTAGGEAVPLFADPTWFGDGGSFSPDGRQIAYRNPADGDIFVYDTETGETTQIAARSGGVPLWGPAGSFFFTDLVPDGESLLVHLYRYDIDDGSVTDLSGEAGLVSDGAPSWSDAAGRLALSRRPGRASNRGEVWLMGADGSDQRRLTEDPRVNSGAPSWSPDGRYLAFQRFAPEAPEAEPEIWLYDLATGESRLLVLRGTRPSWRP